MLAIASIQSFAQDVEYYYDAAGNRKTRSVIGPDQAPEEEDGTTVYNSENTKTEVYEDVLAEQQLKIYPNPTRGRLAVEIVHYNLNEPGSIQVFDMGGRLVHNTTVLSQNMQIDITGEPAGSYIMVIVIGKEKSEWKIIKQ
jgi:hypothetical protein